VSAPAPPLPAGPETGQEFILLGPSGSRPFQAAEVEAELRGMWRSAGTDGATQGHPVYRAALANLVVPLDTRDLERLTPVLVELARRHPSRLFLVELCEGPAETPLRARVTALCHLRPRGGGVVCSEQIVLQATPDGEPLLPSAVRSLLVGDLPVIVLDVHAGPDRAWIDDLALDADLLLGDSALEDSLDAAASFWGSLGRRGTGRVHDVAWARLLPWREVLAELFDSPALAGTLSTIEEVRIEHAPGLRDEPSPPALLLAGWLAGRLRWKVGRREGDALRLSSTHGAVRVAFRAAPEADARTVARLRIRSGPPRAATLEVEPRGREPAALVTLSRREPGAAGAEASERRYVPFRYRDFATCIVTEVHRHAPNPVLEEAVACATALLGAWERREGGGA